MNRELTRPLDEQRLHQIVAGLLDQRPISVADAALTITDQKREAFEGRLIVLDRAAGVTVTLPTARGTGETFDFLVGTTVTSNNDIIKVGNTTDTMVGQLEAATTTGATTNGFCEAAGGTDDTITMNGTTTGGIAGSRVRCRDVKAGLWYVEGFLVGSGTLATSLSATV